MQIRNHSPHDRDLTLSSKLCRRFLHASVLSLFLLAIIYGVVPIFVAEASATEQVDANVAWNAIYMIIDPDVEDTDTDVSDPTHGDIVFSEIVPTLNDGNGNVGTLMIKKKTIMVDTNGKYFSAYISTDNNSNALRLSSNSSIGINATTGSWATPAAFSHTGWGISVPGTTVPVEEGSETLPDFPSAEVFSASVLDRGLTKATGGAAYTSKFAAVPTEAAPQQVWKATTENSAGFSEASGDSEHNKFSIYYGVMADELTLAGDYVNRVVYTVFASSASLDNVSTAAYSSASYGGLGDSTEITFDIAESVSESITEQMVTVKLVPHGYMTTLNYDVSALTAEQLANVLSCPVASGSFSITDHASLTCALPEGADGAQYDFWVNIADYDYNYVSKTYDDEDDVVAAFTYAGLQTKYPASDPRDGETVVTKMQEMTVGVCKMTNMWGTGKGTGARLYDKTGAGTVLFSGVPGYTTTGTDSDLTSGDMGIGSFALIDERDSKPYLIRRLADGNCWMVQNLDLDLASFVGKTTTKQGALTPDNTDLNSTAAKTRGYYDPQEKLWNTTSGQSTLTAKLNSIYGAQQEAQFQSGQQRNTDVTPKYNWGTSGGSNTAAVAYARSYDNINLAYVPTNQSSGASTTIVSGGVNYHLQNRATVDGLNNYKDTTWTPAHAMQYVGDYYNWYAATAESGTWAMTSGEAEDSLCPKGWRLPINGGDNNTTDKSWRKLLFGVYGLADNNSTSINQMHMTPLSFAFTGYYHWSNGYLLNRGYGGYWWSSTASSTSAYAYDLDTVANPRLIPQNQSNNIYGLTVRCVAR